VELDNTQANEHKQTLGNVLPVCSLMQRESEPDKEGFPQLLGFEEE